MEVGADTLKRLVHAYESFALIIHKLEERGIPRAGELELLKSALRDIAALAGTPNKINLREFHCDGEWPIEHEEYWKALR